jgi:hypothetical protein
MGRAQVPSASSCAACGSNPRRREGSGAR